MQKPKTQGVDIRYRPDRQEPHQAPIHIALTTASSTPQQADAWQSHGRKYEITGEGR
jgi:hypothetical protein